MTSTAANEESAHAPRARKLALIGCLVLLGVLAVGVLALHLTAYDAYRSSFSTNLTLAERAAAARRAHRLEPWDTRFSVRDTVMAWWVRGKQLLDSGDWNGAVAVLAQAYRLDVGDAQLLALFKRAQSTQSLETNGKAHVQHGHEGPGGTLRPEDVVK
ncbi:MAG TPA: hypothetical protein VIL41_06305 [Coriobacteriia bacterium]